MASMYTSDGHLARAIFTRILLVAVTTAIIVWQLPHDSEKHRSYDSAKVWEKGTIIAPYDIPIKKRQAVIDAERDSVTRLILPYYTADNSVVEQHTKRFLAKYSTGIEGLPKSFTNSVVRKLQEIYSYGIINQEDYARLSKDTLACIRIKSNSKYTSRKHVRELLTPLTAYEKFFSDRQMESVKAQLQQCNLNEYFTENLKYNAKLTEREISDALQGLSQNAGLILKGEKIIDNGEVVTPQKEIRLDSYYEELSKRNSEEAKNVTLIGQIFFVLFLMTLFTIYLHLFRGDYFSKPRSLSMVYILITIYPVILSLMMRSGFIASYAYALPYAILPILIRVFLDSRTAVMAHFVMVFICSLAVSEQYVFIITQILSGIVAIYSLRELSRRSQILTAALLVTLTNILVMYANHLTLPGDDMTLDMTIVKYMLFSGIFILLLYPLMLLVEKVFGFTSAVTLFELSDTNKHLLRNLSEVAPGTFQHSIMVGNLAAAIATKIGAKSLLVRTGALYHDIGKMTNPVFFTENQAGTSPHDRMTPIESAQVIVSHVTEGVRLAEKYGLPDVIRDFILTHHGAGMAKYFYITYKNEHPNEDVDTSLFSYPGPNPFTREQAILMMADSVEAASRSLSEYTEETITTLVNRIIDAQVADGFFRECPITFHDIAMAKLVLIDKLKSLYHTRVSYPELKK